MQENIRKIIKESLDNISVDIDISDINLEYPADLSMGDYSSNVAMVLAKKISKNPREFAQEIVSNIDSDIFEKVEVAGPGFINFYLSKKTLDKSLKDILKEGDYWGRNDELKGQQILVEHSSPNLFKVFHIGHLVNNSIGESISRIIEFSGANTVRISYPSDIGLGIAQAVWGVMNSSENLLEKDVPKKEKLMFLGEAYAFGKKEYVKNEDIKNQINEINQKIYNNENCKEVEIWRKGIDMTKSEFQEFLEELGSKFDHFFFESETAKIGSDIVRNNMGGFFRKGVFKKSDGAIIFEGEKHGLHNRVFINSAGFPTYEAKDLGLLKKKFEKYPNLSKSIFLTDNEQNEYMKVMLEAASMINKDWKEKTVHIGHGRLRLTTGRLSSREGGITPAKEMVDEIKELSLSKMEDKREDVAQDIAISAIKYQILKSAPGKNVVFDQEKSVSFEGNSGPYIQYTYARIKSVLSRADFSIDNLNIEKLGDTEMEIVKILPRFQEVVARAQMEYSPHYIANYIYELASKFNTFYASTKILEEVNENKNTQLVLAKAVATTLKNGLYLLGIKAPERV